jgi:excisionase family DNA binding protein
MNQREQASSFMTMSEAAAYLAVTEGTVHRLMNEHNLPACVAGGQWRFKAESIEAWIRGGCH